MGSHCAGIFPGGPPDKESRTLGIAGSGLSLSLEDFGRPGGQEASNDEFIPIKFLIFLAKIPRRYGAIGEVSEGAGMCLCVLQTPLSLLPP